jgi:hypothetical protein
MKYWAARAQAEQMARSQKKQFVIVQANNGQWMVTTAQYLERYNLRSRAEIIDPPTRKDLQ